MKRLTILALALFVTAITFAQQALWGGSQIVSPRYMIIILLRSAWEPRR